MTGARAGRSPLAAVSLLVGSLALGSLAVGSLVLAGCTPGDDEPAATPSRTASASTSRAPIVPVTDGPVRSADDPALDVAESTPVEDSVYPQVGDPGVDALSYDLDLAWAARTRTLVAVETVVFRSTTDAEQFQLDLGRALEVSSVTVDGAEAAYDHDGKDLVVHTPVSTDRRYTLRLEYAGTPRPVAAPTTRSDFSTSGWTITPHGEVWTMQEPFGAYSWYAVNDQPADKALYSFTISAPSPMVGVANGELISREEGDGTTVTRWELDEPAASYLVTIAIAELRMTRAESPSGVPITYWTPPDARFALRGLRATPRALDWVEEKLGPYPFSTFGILLVPSRSGMETQTMITLGATDYTTSPEVIVHELVHQWYGDQVTPSDWRDVWMNEGMALYLQGIWESERSGRRLDSLMDEWASYEPQMRDEAGPPGAYDPSTFGEGNIYYGPALMWHELRRRIGDELFWSVVRAWPEARDNGNAGRRFFVDWLNRETGQDLTGFYDAWLLDPGQPPRLAG